MRFYTVKNPIIAMHFPSQWPFPQGGGEDGGWGPGRGRGRAGPGWVCVVRGNTVHKHSDDTLRMQLIGAVLSSPVGTWILYSCVGVA